MKTLLIITPHMSTGGCPQVVAKKVEMFKDVYNVICVEWECLAWDYVVQRNRVINILGERFISLSENKEYDLFNVIKDYNPDIIMIEELSETFIPKHILKRLYSQTREYRIFETTHSSYSRPEQKTFLPDKFIFVSPYSADTFKDLGVPYDVIEYPIDKKTPKKEESQKLLNFDPEYKHIVNVGLFTPGKNQKYAFEIAEKLSKYKIKFHFLGNQAVNFRDYWEPLMMRKPVNCEVWGERNDVDTFLQASDMFLFTSTLELNPISIKESLEYDLPTMIFDLKTYYGKYDTEESVTYLTGDIEKDCDNILNNLGIEKKNNKELNIKLVHILLDPNEPKDISEESWKSTVDKQLQSRKCWEERKDYFTSYVPRFNILNREEIPAENCAQPEIINRSKEMVNEPPVLSYGHYGCYKSNKDAIIEEFDEDLDLMVLIGGDVVTDLTPEEFYNKVIEAYNLGIAHGAGLINLNEPVYLSGGEWWKESIDFGDWVKVPHFMVGDIILIFKSLRNDIIEKLQTTLWHSFDIWMAWTYSHNTVQFTSKENLAYQLDGFSVLDYQEKNIDYKETKLWKN